jgi:replicative DNA helicase
VTAAEQAAANGAGGEPSAPRPAREPKPQPKSAARPERPAQDAPPQNLEAEESVLGAILLHPARVIPAVRDLLGPGDFYYEKHALIYTAAVALHDRGEGVDFITVTAELERTRRLADAGGKAHLAELPASVPSTANAPTWAKRVADAALARALINASHTIAELGWAQPDDAPALLARAEAALDPARLRVRERRLELDEFGRDRATGGGAFAFDEPADVPAVWGDGHAVAWAAGEPLMLVGPDGVGKTAVQQQLLLARLGLRDNLLGQPVAPATRPILYVAADRPRQAARSLRRMVTEDERAQLDERLLVWRGPLPFDPSAEPDKLARFARSFGAGDLFVDALKDIALDLTKDEAASRVARAFQEVIAEGIELCISHHQRKEISGATKSTKPTRLADVYGSRWLTAGMGSVILLWAEAGDPVVELAHLKQPAEDIGPLRILHDHVRGYSTVYHAVDLEQLADEYGGVTAQRAATLLYATEKPTANQVEKARRRLDALVAKGDVYRDVTTGGTTYLTRRP